MAFDSEAEASERSARGAGLLKDLRPRAERQLRWALVLQGVSGLFVIGQAAIVASVVDQVAFRGAGLADVQGWLSLLAVVVAARAWLSYAGEMKAIRAGLAVGCALREQLVGHVLKLGPSGLAGEPTGRLVAAATDAVQAIEPFFARYLPATRLAVLLPLAILAVVLPLDLLSALVLLVTAPLIPLFMVLVGGGAEKLNRRQWRRLARMSGHFLDLVQGLATLEALGASRRAAGSVTTVAEDYRRDTMAVLRVAFLSSLVLEFFATVSIAMIAVLIGFRLLWGEMAFFHGFLVLLLAPELYLPLRTLGSAYHARMEAIGAADRIAAVLDLPLPARHEGLRRLDFPSAPSIVFEDVHVTFADGREALAGLSFAIAPGERVALAGPSGAGKSTVLNLLLGFNEPTSGRILVGGVPLAELDRRWWLEQTAYLRQRPHVFDATIAQNIAMRLDAAPTELDGDRIRDAARRAFADDFIRSLPEGYETRAGERGTGLSGGEVQRLALARAFYRDARLVLIDEAAAHLDRETEATISRALGDLAHGRTMLTIAHRPSSLRDADRILVLDRGRLADARTRQTFLGHAGLLHAAAGPLAVAGLTT
jgi:ATP-binding cassette subfamily C protein CydD